MSDRENGAGCYPPADGWDGKGVPDAPVQAEERGTMATVTFKGKDGRVWVGAAVFGPLVGLRGEIGELSDQGLDLAVHDFAVVLP